MNVADRPLVHGARHQDPTKIVVHAMGEFIRFRAKDLSAYELLQVVGFSAHALIPPSGTLVRCRRDDQGAFHAKNHNRHSLGVEFLVPGVHTMATFALAIAEPDWLSDPQLETGILLVARWCKSYDITIDNIHRHSTIDPARKIDPGEGFPWELFLEGVEAQL